ncbi:protein phosphatase inhibitor IPP2 [Cardiosporidium cionae]|uniref:Protein phosphatase inhibitor IPP2 n=1 Tax=Cardiosporidium cionae TaxID=476202 RepID=A0ABQ7JEC5_9APIC|nr:protein phosphatase inhibitor IPP2 [Cardiosporidium cionae]|eukprot:KAF8822318.1 protein phosphatase inhibitor IPP2 [Cardiosporidium cionae]
MTSPVIDDLEQKGKEELSSSNYHTVCLIESPKCPLAPLVVEKQDGPVSAEPETVATAHQGSTATTSASVGCAPSRTIRKCPASPKASSRSKVVLSKPNPGRFSLAEKAPSLRVPLKHPHPREFSKPAKSETIRPRIPVRPSHPLPQHGLTKSTASTALFLPPRPRFPVIQDGSKPKKQLVSFIPSQPLSRPVLKGNNASVLKKSLVARPSLTKTSAKQISKAPAARPARPSFLPLSGPQSKTKSSTKLLAHSVKLPPHHAINPRTTGAPSPRFLLSGKLSAVPVGARKPLHSPVVAALASPNETPSGSVLSKGKRGATPSGSSSSKHAASSSKAMPKREALRGNDTLRQTGAAATFAHAVTKHVSSAIRNVSSTFSSSIKSSKQMPKPVKRRLKLKSAGNSSLSNGIGMSSLSASSNKEILSSELPSIRIISSCGEVSPKDGSPLSAVSVDEELPIGILRVPSGRSKSLSWDEFTIALHDLERGRYSPIDEPKTPFPLERGDLSENEEQCGERSDSFDSVLSSLKDKHETRGVDAQDLYDKLNLLGQDGSWIKVETDDMREKRRKHYDEFRVLKQMRDEGKLKTEEDEDGSDE